MKTRHFLALTTMAVALASCQSNSYKIQGNTEGFSEGDTLFMTTELSSGIPSDTMIVKEGHFDLKGEADSAKLSIIYAPGHPNVSALFFVEPGTINITLSQNQDNVSIGGTKANDALQELNKIASDYGKKIQEIGAIFYDPNASEESKKQAMEQEQKLQAELANKVAELAEKNIDNELGFFLITNFSDDEVFSMEKRRVLIDKMPANFKNRQEVKDLLQTMEAMEAIAVGKPITDFTLNTPEGTPLSAMSEVGKNKITILDFWASWCGPCRQEMPFMIELYKKYHEQGLGILGISLDDDKDAWVKAIGDLGISWPQMSDLKGWKSEAGQLFQVSAIPFMVIVDQNGTILQKGLRGEQLEQFVSEQLK